MGGLEDTGVPSAVTVRGTQPLGNNTASADMILSSGQNRGIPATGSGAHASVVLQTSTTPNSSGGTQGSLIHRFEVNGVVKNVSANNTAQSLFEIALPDLTGCGGSVWVTVFASDGTDHQIVRTEFNYAAVNKAATYTTDLDTAVTSSALSAGTLSVTGAVTTGTNKITFQVTPNTSLTTTTYYIVWTALNDSEQALTNLM